MLLDGGSFYPTGHRQRYGLRKRPRLCYRRIPSSGSGLGRRIRSERNPLAHDVGRTAGNWKCPFPSCSIAMPREVRDDRFERQPLDTRGHSPLHCELLTYRFIIVRRKWLATWRPDAFAQLARRSLPLLWPLGVPVPGNPPDPAPRAARLGRGSTACSTAGAHPFTRGWPWRCSRFPRENSSRRCRLCSPRSSCRTLSLPSW